MKKSKLLSKIIAASMVVAMIGGVGANTAFQSYIGANISVNAVVYSSGGIGSVAPPKGMQITEQSSPYLA